MWVAEQIHYVKVGLTQNTYYVHNIIHKLYCTYYIVVYCTYTLVYIHASLYMIHVHILHNYIDSCVHFYT